MRHTCLRQPPFATPHVNNGKIQLYETLLRWGGVELGDYKCLGKVIRQLPKSFSWNGRWAQELRVVASTWNQKNTWGRVKLLILWRHEENQGKCWRQFFSVSSQNHPLNVTLSNVPASNIHSVYSTAKCGCFPRHGLRWTKVFVKYLNKNPLNLWTLQKDWIKSTHPPDAEVNWLSWSDAGTAQHKLCWLTGGWHLERHNLYVVARQSSSSATQATDPSGENLKNLPWWRFLEESCFWS